MPCCRRSRIASSSTSTSSFVAQLHILHSTTTRRQSSSTLLIDASHQQFWSMLLIDTSHRRSRIASSSTSSLSSIFSILQLRRQFSSPLLIATIVPADSSLPLISLIILTVTTSQWMTRPVCFPHVLESLQFPFQNENNSKESFALASVTLAFFLKYKKTRFSEIYNPTRAHFSNNQKNTTDSTTQ